MFSTKRLYELQELDLEVSAKEKSLAEVQARLKDDSALVSAKEVLERAESQLRERVATRRLADLDMQQLEDKRQAVEKKLFGGAVTNPRELSSYELERNMVQKQLSARGDELLELMVEIEDMQSARDQAHANLLKLEAEHGVEHAELQKAEQRLMAELNALRQSRNGMIPEVPPSVLSLYESLRMSRNGHAVAKVERGLCQGCRLALPTKELQRARGSQEIVQCSSCRRILYAL